MTEKNLLLPSPAAVGRATTPAGAIFSEDRRHRYVLWRRWGSSAKTLVVVGLNPSTADEVADDPTIRRCVGFAGREGCSALTMLNLYALRATDPVELQLQNDTIGARNDYFIRLHTSLPGALVVVAWGSKLPPGSQRDAQVIGLLRAHCPTQVFCFGLTKRGHPRHPLYLPASEPLVNYRDAIRRWR